MRTVERSARRDCHGHLGSIRSEQVSRSRKLCGFDLFGYDDHQHTSVHVRRPPALCLSIRAVNLVANASARVRLEEPRANLHLLVSAVSVRNRVFHVLLLQRILLRRVHCVCMLLPVFRNARGKVGHEVRHRGILVVRRAYDDTGVDGAENSLGHARQPSLQRRIHSR